MKKKSIFVLLVCGICLLTLGVSSVYSTWFYSNGSVPQQEAAFSIVMGAPDYPEEGYSHRALIEALIGEEKGLNNPDSYLNQQIALRQTFGKDTLGSMAIYQGSQLDELFNADSANIAFIVQSIDENGDGETDYYYIFTTDQQLGSQRNPNFAIGTYISPIYRSKVVKNAQGEWEAGEAVEGKALSAYYSETGLGTLRRIPSFDPDTWVQQ